MKNLLRVAPFSFVLLAGCASLGNVDVSKLTGGRIQTIDMNKMSKAGTALRKGFEDISESEEYYIGRAVSAQIMARYKPLKDSDLNAYAQKVAETVAMASDRPSTFKGYHVQVLDSDEVNAFAAPGGFLFVTKGLLKLVKSEDELGCVLAHEVAHVAKKHGLKAIQTARLTTAFTLLGSEAAKNYTPAQMNQLTNAFEGTVNDVVNKLITNGYSRDKEYEADRFAAQYAKAANYDPGALKAFLKRMDAASVAHGGMFKTHPTGANRISELGSQSPSSSYKKSAERDRRFSAVVAF